MFDAPWSFPVPLHPLFADVYLNIRRHAQLQYMPHCVFLKLIFINIRKKNHEYSCQAQFQSSPVELSTALILIILTPCPPQDLLL